MFEQTPFGLVSVSPFTGQARTCPCARVLYYSDEGTFYRAVCGCGRAFFEHKDIPKVLCFCPPGHDPHCRREHVEV